MRPWACQGAARTCQGAAGTSQGAAGTRQGVTGAGHGRGPGRTSVLFLGETPLRPKAPSGAWRPPSGHVRLCLVGNGFL